MDCGREGAPETPAAPKHCPVCGQVPDVLPAFLKPGYYVVCHGHVETRVAPTREEAIRLWNAGELDPRCPT